MYEHKYRFVTSMGPNEAYVDMTSDFCTEDFLDWNSMICLSFMFFKTSYFWGITPEWTKVSAGANLDLQEAFDLLSLTTRIKK